MVIFHQYKPSESHFKKWIILQQLNGLADAKVPFRKGGRGDFRATDCTDYTDFKNCHAGLLLSRHPGVVVEWKIPLNLPLEKGDLGLFFIGLTDTNSPFPKGGWGDFSRSRLHGLNGFMLSKRHTVSRGKACATTGGRRLD